jgi:adenylate cyclase
MPESHDFGHFSVRLEQRQVLVNGEPAALGGRAFEVLRALLERRDRVVPKDELMQLAWPGVVVEENNLTVQVAALRKLLGASAITTVAGRGYQFTPAVTNPREPQVDTEPAPAPALPRHATRGHLLVAEDNRVNRLLLVRSLELLGHQVMAVDDGRKALEALRAQRFDLLLLDLGMPQMNGFDVLEAMARDPELRDVPVVVTSSVEAVDQVARCIELGADDYLHKPVDPTLLKARVASSLEKARLREQQRELVQRLTVAAAGQARPAERVALQAERAEATMLAVKLRNATGAALAAAELVGWLDECHTLWRDAVANHGGLVLGDCGGTLLALFGIASGPTPAPTMAQARLSATRAALDMAEMQDLFNAERVATGRAGAGLAVGIASGSLTVGPARAGLPSRCVCLGEPVDAALAMAWQASSAEPHVDMADGHHLWIDAATQAALTGRVATQALATPPASAADLSRAGVFAVKLS